MKNKITRKEKNEFIKKVEKMFKYFDVHSQLEVLHTLTQRSSNKIKF